MSGPILAGKKAGKRLAEALREITGFYAVTEVRITPARYGNGTVHCAMALASNRREIPLPGAVRKEVVDLLNSAFPGADWSRAQDYNVTAGVLSEHVVRLPACLRGDAR
ncbi:hypothetical protein ACIP4S_13300 [Streptomyces chartreusis]|uniref:hypothetical protein n=1 Tax=Streptomyces chartreusis TaxID=1969 RepID=UPI00382C69CC